MWCVLCMWQYYKALNLRVYKSNKAPHTTIAKKQVGRDQCSIYVRLNPAARAIGEQHVVWFPCTEV